MKYRRLKHLWCGFVHNGWSLVRYTEYRDERGGIFKCCTCGCEWSTPDINDKDEMTPYYGEKRG